MGYNRGIPHFTPQKTLRIFAGTPVRYAPLGMTLNITCHFELVEKSPCPSELFLFVISSLSRNPPVQCERPLYIGMFRLRYAPLNMTG